MDIAGVPFMVSRAGATFSLMQSCFPVLAGTGI